MGLNPTSSTSGLAVAQLLSTASIQHRAYLSKEFTKLRRVRPRVPFFKLVAHRLPTLWGLYRDLIRCLPDIRESKKESKWRWKDFRDEEWASREHGTALLWHVRRSFRQQRSLTSPQKCKECLLFWYKLLEHLQSPVSNRFASKLSRYERILRARREKIEMQQVYEKELEWIKKMKNRPILTGGYLRPTINNRPLPRMKNQPIHITMMIRNRIKARAKRMERQTQLIGWLEDAKAERVFEAGLRKEALDENGMVDLRELDFEDGGYQTAIRDSLRSISESFELDRQRASSRFTPEMIGLIKNARKVKLANKTRERQRELRGEITNRALKRMRQGPPAHILTKMSEEEKRLDKVAREVSRGGYSGSIKRQRRKKDRRRTKELGASNLDENEPKSAADVE
ncbi:hypothetical protein FRB91_003607 [Serendipita sp. 411]|nr:hypothetical protein FRB91_003607 [Serendipita sp. 411]